MFAIIFRKYELKVEKGVISDKKLKINLGRQPTIKL